MGNSIPPYEDTRNPFFIFEFSSTTLIVLRKIIRKAELDLFSLGEETVRFSYKMPTTRCGVTLVSLRSSSSSLYVDDLRSRWV